MSSFRFVHASHLHLDAPVRGVDGAGAEWQTALRDASLAAWSAVVDLAIERRAAFLLLAGGLLGSDSLSHPTARAVAALLDGARKLGAAGIPILTCVGPDDGEPSRRYAAAVALACGGTVFDSRRFTALPIIRDGARIATVHGASSLGGEWQAPLPRAIRRSGTGIQIALAPVDPINPVLPVLPALPVLPTSRGVDPTTNAAALASCDFDYWAIGGSHQFAEVHDSRASWIVSAGTPQGRGTETAEAGPKGGVVVEVDGDRVAAAELVPLDRVRFAHLHADVDLDDVAALSVRLVRRLEAEAHGFAGGLAVAEVTLGADSEARGGESRSAHRSHRSTLAARLLAELRRTAEGRRPAVFWNRVRDHAFHSRQTAAAPGTLAHVIGERAEGLANATLPRSTFLAEHLTALRRVWAGELDVASAPSLVREAAARAVEMLAAETQDENSQLGN